ncbi:MAG: hypothetical protein P8166_12145 [Candidatus Thiodiazotropha sp.]
MIPLQLRRNGVPLFDPAVGAGGRSIRLIEPEEQRRNRSRNDPQHRAKSVG